MSAERTAPVARSFLRCQRDVIEEAEAAVEVETGMVARGPHQCEGRRLERGLCGSHGSSGRQPGHLEQPGIALDRLDEPGAVAEGKVFKRAGRRFLEVGDVADAGVHVGNAVRVLAVNGVVVVEEPIAVKDADLVHKIVDFSVKITL